MLPPGVTTDKSQWYGAMPQSFTIELDFMIFPML
jgi:hypothetical protein